MQNLLARKDSVGNPQDDIEGIFNKIQKWKEGFGNLDDQEKAVAKKMKPAPGKKVDIHNIKTLTEHLLGM